MKAAVPRLAGKPRKTSSGSLHKIAEELYKNHSGGRAAAGGTGWSLAALAQQEGLPPGPGGAQEKEAWRRD